MERWRDGEREGGVWGGEGERAWRGGGGTVGGKKGEAWGDHGGILGRCMY